jgi:molybdate transport system permease protein
MLSEKTFKYSVILLSAVTLALFALPPLFLVVRAINNQAWRRLPESGVSEAIILSLLTTMITVNFIVLLGTPLAYALARWEFPYKSLVGSLIELPIVLPPAVAGLALLITFGRRGFFGPTLEQLGISLPFTTAAVVIAQLFVAAPFYIRSAQVGFRSVPTELEDAAQVDGASSIEIFRFIIIPLSWRSLAAGLTLSWTRALGEFGATILFAGNLQGRTQTMPLLVYNVLERDIDAAIWTGLILIGIALLSLTVLRLLNLSSEASLIKLANLAESNKEPV